MSSSRQRFEKWQGAWVSFWPEPEKYEIGNYHEMKIFIGQVIGIEFLPNSEIGDIPQAKLMIRGQSGRTMTINSLENNAMRHPSHAEALERKRKAKEGYKE